MIWTRLCLLFHCLINYKKEVKHYDSYVMFKAKSKMDVVVIENMFLRFWDDTWVKVAINKRFRIEQNKFNYLGTLIINLNKMDKYSGAVISGPTHEAGSIAAYYYDVVTKMKHDESDFKDDLKFIEDNYPNIFNSFKDKVIFLNYLKSF